MVARLMQALLQRRTLHATIVDTDTAALDALRQDDSLRLVIASASLPQSGGLALLDSIRSTAKWESLPVILCSDIGEEVLVREAISLGCSSFVLKPIRAGHFLKSVDETLAGSTAVLRNRREVASELGTDLRGYQRVARLLAREVDDTLGILGARDAGIPIEEIVHSLYSLEEGMRTLGANRAKYQVDKVKTLYESGLASDLWVEIQKLMAELRRLQAALLAA